MRVVAIQLVRHARQRQTKHDWDDAGDGDDKNRVQMTNDITKYRALVERISFLSQDRPDLKFAGNASMLCDGKLLNV